MSDPYDLGLNELGQRVQAMGDPATEPRLRPYRDPYQGAPLPIGPASGGRSIPPYEAFEDLRVTPPPAPAPNPPSGSHGLGGFPGAADGAHSTEGQSTATTATLPASTSPTTAVPDDPNSPKSGLQRAINMVRSSLPLIQKLLPLLDGNFATTVTALLAPQALHHPAPPPIKIDLEPVERGLAELRASQRELRGQVVEQVTTLKRVEDQLERVREATDRNTLEQQELVEDLRSVGSRISTLAVVGLLLLVGLMGVNVYFLVQLQHILR